MKLLHCYIWAFLFLALSGCGSGILGGGPKASSTKYRQWCDTCHRLDGSGIPFFGPAINGNCTLTNCKNRTTLAEYIEANMPRGNPGSCVAECAQETALFITSGFPNDQDDGSTPPPPAAEAESFVTKMAEAVDQGRVIIYDSDTGEEIPPATLQQAK